MRDPVADDGLLVDWLMHYAVLMLLVAYVVTVTTTGWAAFALPRAEMWSVIVDSAQVLPARQLGVVSEALFQTEETYAEAMARIGMTGDPDQLYGIVSLRSVPESRLLIVVARTDDVDSASIAARATARALVRAFERSGYPGLRILGEPQPAPIASGLSVPAVGLSAAVTGIILAVAIAIVAFRMRRPVLSMRRAAAILDPDAVASIPGRGRVLGALRRHPPRISAKAARLASLRFRGPGRSLHAPGLDEEDRRQLATYLGFPKRANGDRLVVACHPGTRERDLKKANRQAGSSLELLWIA